MEPININAGLVIFGIFSFVDERGNDLKTFGTLDFNEKFWQEMNI